MRVLSCTAGAAHHADDVMKAAVEEYLLIHAAEGEDQRLGRHSAIRGLMVRLNRYPDFCAALATFAVAPALSETVSVGVYVPASAYA